MSPPAVAEAEAPVLSVRALAARLGPIEVAFGSRFGWGVAAAVEAGGEGRFQSAARGIAELGEGFPDLIGGFAFEPVGLRFVLPEVTYVADRGAARVVVVAPDAAGRLEAIRRALDAGAELADGGGRTHAPEEGGDAFELSVAAAVQRIARGEIEKVVLARRVVVPGRFDVERTLARLAEQHPSARTFAVRTPEGAFLGASPELLCSVSKDEIRADALAGTRGPADHWTSKEFDEHAAVVRGVSRALAPFGEVRVLPREERRQGELIHLRTPVVCAARAPSLLRVAEALHPTPALGGAPREPALRLLRELEGRERGPYGGGVGVVSSSGEGELWVAIRCARIAPDHAELFAGAGIVRGSRPEAERAETDAKLEVMLSALARAA